MKLLIVIDMQNDFIDGSLGTKEAVAIVPNVAKKITSARAAGETIIFTRDTHQKCYLETQEGKNLPVLHCVEGSDGWQISSKLEVGDSRIFNKPSFGSMELADYVATLNDLEEIEFVGLCTGICVISNAFILKAKLPEVKITVDASCCACVTPESHKTALSAMKLCQINVIGEKEKPQKNKGGVYKLYTELDGFEPKIHRTFLIKKNTPMLSLASCMISMFDGNASHIYDFDVPSENLNLQVYFDEEKNASDDEFAIKHKHIQPRKHVDVRNYKVKDCLKKVGDTITFAYDFGDGWTFPIRLEEIIDDKVYEEASPLVLDGEGLGIIEDVGGVGAMSDCVKAFEKKSGEDYESYSEWLGVKELDITYFNKKAINKSLKKEIKAIDKAYKTMDE